jgi:hypothetical protein
MNGRWIQGEAKARVRGEEREIERRAIYKGGKKRERAMCTRQAEGRHSPWSRDIFAKQSLPNGEGQVR